MSEHVRASGAGIDRFPGFDVLSQAEHWDAVTKGVVLSRLGRPPSVRFFTPDEEGIAVALLDHLLHQEEGRQIPLLPLVDARLAEQQTDGWRYVDMPEDGQAWRDTLAYLDDDSQRRCGTGFATASPEDQVALIQAVQDVGDGEWHGLRARRVWSLWTRYACSAFYSHPWSWNEIGFPGPAYPRGYKNRGVDRREPFEVADVHSDADPVSQAD